MGRAVAVFLLLATAGLAKEPARAAPRSVGVSAEGLARIDEAMGSLVEQKTVAGVVTLVARRGKVVHFQAFGRMDVEADKPMRRDTIFRIYSMTKPVTSVAALMLVERGKLELDAPVAKYVPALKDLKVWTREEERKPERAVTVRDLMRHTSGFVYGWGMSAVDRMYQGAQPLKAPTLEAMIEKLARIPLRRDPGTRWHYSVSTDVLGYVVQVVSGQRFDLFLKEKIFDPLGMKDTGFHVPPEKLDRFAANYGPNLRLIDAPRKSRYASPATLHSGGGGLVSTAGDYLRFCLMLQRGGEWNGKRLLKAATVAEMTRNQLPEELTPIAFGAIPMRGVGFGLGVSVRIARAGMPEGALGEYGWGGAASTGFTISPQEEMIVITMTQHAPFSPVFHGTVLQHAYAAIE